MHLYRQIFLPYVIQRLDDGRHIVLNRLYKPLGVSDPTHLDYSADRSALKIQGLTATQAKAISVHGDDDTAEIYLYDDGTTPDSSPANWAAYAARLQRLAKLKVGPKP